MTSDMIALFFGFLCGGVIAWSADMYVFKGSFQKLIHADTFKEFIIFMGLGGLTLLWLDARGHYRQRLPFWEITGHIVAVVGIGFILCGFMQFAAQGNFSRLWLGLSWLLFGLFLFLGRAGVRRALEQSGQWQIPVLLIGDGPTAQTAEQALRRESCMGFRITDQIPSDTITSLTSPDAWERLMGLHGASHIILALEGSIWEQQQPALKCLARARLPYSLILPWTGLPSGNLSTHYFMMQDVSVLHDSNRLQLLLPRVIKRSFDIIVAGFLLVLLAPALLFISAIIALDKGKILFRQPRIGRNGRTFICYKFRSMQMNAEQLLKEHLASDSEAAKEWEIFQKLKRDVGVTTFGRFIRRSSIDEIPQLVNVLKGDMSLVGPRPIIPGQEHYYEEDFMYYESVRPGITGPWQVNGRNRLTFKERVTLECSYARNWSLWMDMVILLKTIPAIFRNEQVF